METVLRLLMRKLLIGLFAVSFVAACSSSSVRIDRTFEDPGYVDNVYSNVLVIAVAADYNARARFERAMATALSSQSTNAVPYFDVAGGDQEITREKILAAIEAHGYDGVVVTQLGSQQSEVSVKAGTKKTKVVRRDERAVDFFRYDYETLNEPNEINVAMQVILVTDFFEAGEAKRIWSAESTVSDKDNVSYLIDDTAAMIAAKLNKDGLVSH